MQQKVFHKKRNYQKQETKRKAYSDIWWHENNCTGSLKMKQQLQRELNLIRTTRTTSWLTSRWSVICSEYKSLMSMSRVLSRFLANVGVSKVAFSPLMSFTRRNCLKRSWFLKTGGQGRLGPKSGTVSSEYTASRYCLLLSILTTANTSTVSFIKEISICYSKNAMQ